MRRILRESAGELLKCSPPAVQIISSPQLPQGIDAPRMRGTTVFTRSNGVSLLKVLRCARRAQSPTGQVRVAAPVYLCSRGQRTRRSTVPHDQKGAMELRQLRYFVRVVEQGSMSRAALDLDVVQSALSQQITRLESELATRLLQRTPRVA